LDASRTILLVEDNPNDVALTIDAFDHNKLENDIVVARDGAEALELLLPTNGGPVLRPALVLLDLKLPKVDGLEVLRRLRSAATTKYLPIVIMTSSSQDEDRVESYRLGANSYVRKPVEFNAFVEAVRVLGLYWLVINESAPGM
jgi:two-component system response regulator